VLAQVAHRREPVLQVVLVDHLLETHGDRLQVAARQPAVRGKSLGQDQQVFLLLGQPVVIGGQNPPMLARPSFFAENVQPSA
jgi:hypothetical protein